VSDTQPLRILFSAPAYWPAQGFGGPIWEARELAAGLAARGHTIDVVTTTLHDLRFGRSLRSHSASVDEVSVHYLATPFRYRWMGVTPTAPLLLGRLKSPDVAHILGFRDPIGVALAAWCRRHQLPYVLQPLGMLMPQLRKVRMKRVLDSVALAWIPRGAARIVVTSGRERAQVLATGAAPERVIVRPIGFPAPDERVRQSLRRLLGIDGEPLVLYVGRIAAGKGIELLLETTRRLPEMHLALVGPDAGHGVARAVAAAQNTPGTAGRVHRLEVDERPLGLYADADVFVLPSAGESFGIVAAEAAAAGTPVVVTDRCGIAETFRDGGALVVPYDSAEVTAAVERVLVDHALRSRLSAEALAVAARHSWATVIELQERIYRDVLAGAR
jgi:glycosyltransferase involved in cell wall biosynthesis